MIAFPVARPNLPKVPRDALAARNVLCRRRMPVAFEALGGRWEVRLGPPRAPRDAVCLVFDWGGACVQVRLPRVDAAYIVSALLETPAPCALPEPVMLAAIGHALAPGAEALQRAARKQLRLAGIDANGAPLDGPVLGWEASCGEAALGGDLVLDAVSARYLAAAMQEVQADPAGGREWDALAVPVRFVIGHVDLCAGAVRSLGVRDVLLADESWLDRDGEIWVQAGPSAGFVCRMEENGLRVVEGVGEMMAEAEEQAFGQEAGEGAGGANGPLLDDIPVRLTFDVGQRAMTLAELRTLQEGYLFNLGREPRSAVCIRANGRPIGEGELVDIEGRIGVSIVRLSGPAATAQEEAP